MLNNEYLFNLDTGAALALFSGRYEVAGAKKRKRLVKLIKNFQFFTQTMK